MLTVFFNVWQDVLQTKLSKMTIPPEGASDGFANNFDQLKWRKTSFHLFGFSRTCQIWAEPLIAPFYISPCHLSHLLPERTHFNLFTFSTSILRISLCCQNKLWSSFVHFLSRRKCHFLRIFIGDWYCYCCKDLSANHHILAFVLIAF